MAMKNLGMLKNVLVVLFLCGLLYAGTQDAAAASSSPQRPFPQHVAYAPGTTWPNSRTQEQMDDDVCAFYDYWKSNYLDEVPGSPTRYRVLSGHNRTVSEGQGYGMVIVALSLIHI